MIQYHVQSIPPPAPSSIVSNGGNSPYLFFQAYGIALNPLCVSLPPRSYTFPSALGAVLPRECLLVFEDQVKSYPFSAVFLLLSD